MNKKLFVLLENRGSLINDLDQAIENGYKVQFEYLNDATGNYVMRSAYLFSRGMTSRGKICYRSFQYNPNTNSFEYISDKNHGWRLFDIEKIRNYTVFKTKSKLHIKGELPEWVSSINKTGDKMFPKGVFKIMDIDLFMDKKLRGNASLRNRKYQRDKELDAIEKAKELELKNTKLSDTKNDDSFEKEITGSETPTNNVNKNIDNKPKVDIFKDDDKTVDNNVINKSDLTNNDEEIDQIDNEKNNIITKKDLIKKSI